MGYAVGTRVGAVASGTETTVDFLGYGVYAGDHKHPILPFKNPRIDLDNGEHVWGCECWWGPEDKIKANYVDGKTVKYVRVVRDETGRGIKIEDVPAN